MNHRKQFAQPPDNNVMPRFSGFATFMRTPIIETFTDVDIAMVGVPWDGGVTNRAGARHGPREVRNMSSLIRRVHHATGINPFALTRVGDAGDVPINPINNDKTLAQIELFYADLHAAGAIPLSCGGDHLITLPIMRAIARHRPVGMVHFDAHTDTGDSAFDGEKYHHGTPFRRAVEEGLLDPKRTIQIGIRGARATADYSAFSHHSGMRVVYIEEYFDMGYAAVIKEARRVVGDGPVYISFDVDGLDPVYAPGTGTPEIGGYSTHEAQRMIRGLQGLDIVGADVVEVAPPFDPTGNTALVGATMMFELLCILADAVAQRRG
jgi:guanidinopropionase